MKEYAALAALESTSADYVKRMENIDLDCNLMADAGKGLSSPICESHESVFIPIDRPQCLEKCTLSGQRCSGY